MANTLINTTLRWLGSKVPTSLMHMSDISQVTVLMDADAADFAESKEKVKDYFASRGIQLTICPVRSRKLIKACRDTQVLISLVPSDNWHVEYVVRRSCARFKIGRMQLPGDVFDLVVSDPQGTQYPQSEVFTRMMELMEGMK